MATDGRSASIWDAFARVPGRIADNTTGDVAADSYRQWRNDISLLRDMHAKSYRFSVSWSRVINKDGSVNAAGVKYYEDLVRGLVLAGIRPFATLFHWDLPLFFDVARENYPQIFDNTTAAAASAAANSASVVSASAAARCAGPTCRGPSEPTKQWVVDSAGPVHLASHLNTTATEPAFVGAAVGALLADLELPTPRAADAPVTVRGWADPSRWLAPLFLRYAALMFRVLSPLGVRDWATFNEPHSFCVLGYGSGQHAPGRCADRARCPAGSGEREQYQCGHTVLLAHAYAAKLYKEHYASASVRAGASAVPTSAYASASTSASASASVSASDSAQTDCRGSITIVLNSDFIFPASLAPLLHTRTAANPLPLLSPADVAAAPAPERAAAARALAFSLGWFADPLFRGGRYPRAMRRGLPAGMLPAFTAAQRAVLRDAVADVFAVNHYTSRYARPAPGCEDVDDGDDDDDDDGDDDDYYEDHGGDLCSRDDTSGRSRQKPQRSLLGRILDSVMPSRRDREVRPPRVPARAAAERTPPSCATVSELDDAGRLIGPQADSPWLYSVPAGLPLLMQWITERYSEPFHRLHARFNSKMSPVATCVPHVPSAAASAASSARVLSAASARKIPIVIAESGCDEPGRSAPDLPLPVYLHDPYRTQYMQNYSRALFAGAGALQYNVRALYAWSLVDNFEWAEGLSKRFGLYYVKYTKTNTSSDAAAGGDGYTVERLPKEAVKWYGELARDHTQLWPVCPALRSGTV